MPGAVVRSEAAATDATNATDAVALLLLDGLPGVGPRTVGRLVTAFGSAESALEARVTDFEAIAGGAAARARREKTRRAHAIERLDRATAAGTRVVTWNANDYPAALRQLADPPPLLFLRGRFELLDTSGVAVVGSRRATVDGRDTARRLGRSLARSGTTVWSGLALGIDGAAHAGALEAGGDTVAVLGSGIDVPYPPRHRALYDRIEEEGLLLSEFAPGESAAPWTFPRRNRLLAALAATVVVVEAAAKSGALITVDHALDLGRDIWAVPGPIDRAACAGSNRMLADGARPLVSVADFVAEVGRDVGRDIGSDVGGSVDPGRSREGAGESAGRGPSGRTRTASPPTASLQRSLLEVGVLEVLAGDPLVAEEVARRCGLDIPTTLALLTTLEIHGDVERLPGPRFRVAA